MQEDEDKNTKKHTHAQNYEHSSKLLQQHYNCFTITVISLYYNVL